MSELEREFEYYEPVGLVVTEDGLCESFPDYLDVSPIRVYGISSLSQSVQVDISDLEFHYDAVDIRKT